MTDEEIIAVVTAHKEGKTIEYRHVEQEEKDWEVIARPCWSFAYCDYRIKPEPHYRPFESAEEVMEAIKEHGSWLDSPVGHMVNISEFNNAYIWIGVAKSGISFKDAFNNNHHFEKDGTPFGKLVED